HTHKSGIDAGFTVRMVVAAGVAADLGTLDPRCRGTEIQVIHSDEDSSLRRLKAIAHVRQSPADNHAHGVSEIAVLWLFFDVERLITLTVAIRRGWALRRHSGRNYLVWQCRNPRY